MVGTPHVNHVRKTAVDLVLVVGDVGSKIGVAAIRFPQRPVHVVAECCGAKKRLLGVFPTLNGSGLGRRQASLVNIAPFAQLVDRAADEVAPFYERTLREEYVVLYVERGEIIPD